MSSLTELRSSLKYGWALGESGWNVEMDANLLRIGRFGFHLSIKDRDLATPPGTPTAGDCYIVAASPTGAWVGHAADVAVWSGSAWAFATPRAGWCAYIEDEAVESHFTTAWQAGNSIHDLRKQPAPTAKTANATLTIAELLTRIVTATSASAVALTLPTGTLTDAGFLLMPIDTALEWSVINLGSSSGVVTMTPGTDHTYVGNAVVAIGTSAAFKTRKTAANTFVTYRVS